MPGAPTGEWSPAPQPAPGYPAGAPPIPQPGAYGPAVAQKKTEPSVGARILRGWLAGMVYGQWWTIWTVFWSLVWGGGSLGGSRTMTVLIIGVVAMVVVFGFVGSVAGILIGALDAEEGTDVAVDRKSVV